MFYVVYTPSGPLLVTPDLSPAIDAAKKSRETIKVAQYTLAIQSNPNIIFERERNADEELEDRWLDDLARDSYEDKFGKLVKKINATRAAKS